VCFIDDGVLVTVSSVCNDPDISLSCLELPGCDVTSRTHWFTISTNKIFDYVKMSVQLYLWQILFKKTCCSLTIPIENPKETQF